MPNSETPLASITADLNPSILTVPSKSRSFDIKSSARSFGYIIIAWLNFLTALLSNLASKRASFSNASNLFYEISPSI